jgi:oxalyl-CoA decarboxylase
LDLPAQLLSQTLSVADAKKSIFKVIDPVPRQIPAADAVARALDVLKNAKRPLILLGKGAAYAQADADIKALIEKSGIPYLPMSMAKGLLPDDHPQTASPARSFVLAEADTVLLIGARLNWLLAHGKGKTWGKEPKKFIQIDIQANEVDSNVQIAAPLIGDIGSCVGELLKGIASVPKPSAEWISAINERKDKNMVKMAETLAKDTVPMNFHSALRVIRDVVKKNPDINLVNEGANTLDYCRAIVNMYKPRKRFDSGTWGIMGIGMGYAIGAAVTSGLPVIAVEGDSAFGFSGMELETICRYNLPITTVIFNNNGVYRGTDVNPTGGADVAPTVFVKNARYDKMIEAFGGIGYNVTTPQELEKALTEAIAAGKPALINAVIDEAAGTESGRLTNLNPASTATKK